MQLSSPYSSAVPPFSVIPWFKLEAWDLPLPPLGSVPIQPFGVLAAIAIILGSRAAEWRAQQTGVPRKIVSDFIVHTVVIGLLSCAFLNVLLYEPEKFAQMGRAIASWFGAGEPVSFPYPGLSSFGGFFGGTLAAWWFRHKRKVSLLVVGDIICFAFPLAWIFARSGCFVVHDHPGVASDFFLAVDNYNGQGVARHDLGLYEVIWALVVTPVVFWLGRKPRPWGFFIAFLTLAYAPIRFFLDFLRETPVHGGDVRYLGLTPAQYFAVLMLLVGIAVALRVRRGPPATLMLDGTSPAPTDANDGTKSAVGKTRAAH
jgi:phosphatidylglycerol:prolipoprotein diacylglycerol transferase